MTVTFSAEDIVGKFLLGVVIGMALLVAGLYFYFVSGNAPVATSSTTMPFEKALARKALHAVLEKEVPKNVPIQADEASYSAGIQVYRQNCAVCHGLPGQPETEIAHG